MLIFNPSKMFFMFSLILGVIITISSNSWFTAWLGLELNLLSFIPIISSKFNRYSSEAALKYFLVQALGSAIILSAAPATLLFGIISNFLILLALLLKMGAAPVHFWFPSVMNGMNWMQCLILMTIQKIPAMFILTYTLTPTSEMTFFWMIMITSLLSAVVGSLGGLNQTLLRKLMAYSSINHMAWMLAASLLSESTWITYFISYSLISSSVVMIMHSQQIFHFNHLSNLNFNSVFIKLSCFFALLSLGGLPPFLGFIPKWVIMQELIKIKAFIWLSGLLISALLTLYFYLRMALSAFTLSSPKIKISANFKSVNIISVSSVINLLPIFTPFMLLMHT